MINDKCQMLKDKNPGKAAGANLTFSIQHSAFIILRRGFTIIEMLVVIAIAGVLLSGALVLFQSARTKSRDVTREQHIKTLQNALALYANDLGVYPVALSEVVLTGSDSVSVTLTAQNSIARVPHDPLEQGNYQYRYQSVDGTTYIIRYWLETNSVFGKSAGQNTAGP